MDPTTNALCRTDYFQFPRQIDQSRWIGCLHLGQHFAGLHFCSQSADLLEYNWVSETSDDFSGENGNSRHRDKGIDLSGGLILVFVLSISSAPVSVSGKVGTIDDVGSVGISATIEDIEM